MKSAAYIALFLFIAMSSEAQTHSGTQVSHISLLAGAVTPGKPFTLGIRIQMDPGWHTYWSTPGDAGTPIEVTLLDSEDVVAGALRFPTPHKMASNGIVTYGYEDDVVFLLPVKPKNGRAPHQIRVQLQWLVCKDVCLPADTVLILDLSSLTPDQAAQNQQLLDRWTARLPQPGAGFNLDKCGGVCTAGPDGKLSVFIKFYELAPGTIVDFFPNDLDGFAIDYSSINVTSDGIAMTLTAGSAGAMPIVISGVALIGTTGYEVRVPLTKQ